MTKSDAPLPRERGALKPRRTRRSLAPAANPRSGDEEGLLASMFAVVATTAQVNLHSYTLSAVQRGLTRRMAVRQVAALASYVTLLHVDPRESDALCDEVLGAATAFFRDPEVFLALGRTVLPALVRAKRRGAPLRVWVAGCASGEEVYSVAILLAEALGPASPGVRIFASDVRRAAVGSALAGVYPEVALLGVSEGRRQRFFTKEATGYRVSKELRALAAFVVHDLASPPPFQKLDLLLCRNVLSTFNSDAQKRALTTLHDALRQPGFLVLGRTEALLRTGPLFTAVDRSSRIFARSGTGRAMSDSRVVQVPDGAPVAARGRAHDDLGLPERRRVTGREELQVINEELDSTTHELQSANAELTSVIESLRARNREVVQINSDLANVLTAVDVPILIVDAARNIRSFTPKARMILNVVATDVGRHVGDLKLNVDAPDLDVRALAVIVTGAVHESEVQCLDGRWYRLQIRPYMSPDDRVDGAIVTLFDIDELKHHVRVAEEARADAERANQSKDEFLSTLSHELRTPLSSMLMRAQLLRTGELDEAKVRRAGEAIELGVKRQVQLIDDLLDVSRIAAGKLSLELRPVDLGPLLRQVVDAMAVTADRKSIRLEVDVERGGSPRRVLGDAARLQQVVTNLLVNAIKFTPEQGTVRVSLVIEGESAVVAVADTGMGIEAELMAVVFDRFAQDGSKSTRAYGGLGLGLAIVRHLVSLHGGSVTAQSGGRGEGAVFTVTLPLLPVVIATAAAPSSGRLPAPSVDAARLKHLRVLVVDDDQPTREAISDILEPIGVLVRHASSSCDAMAVIEAFRPDVLVSDIAMPGEDGYAFLRRVRALGRAEVSTVPALAVTGLAHAEDRERALAAGFQMHLAKPVDTTRLVAALLELAAANDGAPV